MSKKKENPLTDEIIIETLKRSSLDTVLIEGKDDLLIYRNIEAEINEPNLSFLSCGGRKTLLKVYNRKSELSNRLLFICDSDLWVFLGRPSTYDSDLIATIGYSIENELYQDGEKFVFALLDEKEKEKFNLLIQNVCTWFAFEIQKVLENNAHDCEFSNVSLLNQAIIRKHSLTFNDDFLKERNFNQPDQELLTDLIKDFKLKLRGKYLFQIYEKIFQERDKIGFTRNQLFEMIYRFVIDSGSQDSIIIQRKIAIQNYLRSN